MAKVKKAQKGQALRKFTDKDYARKDSVPSEMFPGKMVAKKDLQDVAPPAKKPAPKKKMQDGGSLKPVPADKKKSLGKLPTAVRNKMGFQKSGGKTKMAKAGCKACWGTKMKKK